MDKIKSFVSVILFTFDADAVIMRASALLLLYTQTAAMSRIKENFTRGELMKHAYYTFPDGTTNYFDRMELAVQYGCDGIEYLNNRDLSEPSMELAYRLRERSDKLGLACPCFSMWAAVMEDPVASVRQIKAYMDMAEVLGAPYFHHTYGPALEGQGPADYMKVALQVARETAAYAAERGMLLLTEPQGLSMNGVEVLREYFDEMGDMAGMVLDTGNVLESNDSNEQLLDALGHKVRHVHIKDMITRKTPPTFPDEDWRVCRDGSVARQTVVGQGELDLSAILSRLKALDYNGWFALEYNAPERFEKYYPISVQNFSTLYKQVYGQDK